MNEPTVALQELPPIGIVIPCYNEGSRLDGEPFLHFCSQHPQVRLLFVNDGSRDNTEAVLKTLVTQAPEQMAVLSLDRNGGKGEAVRQGVLHLARQSGLAYIGYFDADLATPLEEIPYMMAMQKFHEPAKIILGSRLVRGGSHIQRNWLRHYISRLFVTYRELLFPLHIYDTQCGAKLVSAGEVERLFSKPFMSRWLFDIELLSRLHQQVSETEFWKYVLEVPLRFWEEKGASKLTMRYCLLSPIELTRIAWAYRHKKESL